MTLADYQRTLQRLLMTPAGHEALKSETAFAHFLETTTLPEADKAQLLSQSLPRLRQYEFMLLANVQSNIRLTHCYAAQLLVDDWHELLQRFFGEHPCSSYRLQTDAQPFAAFLEGQPEILERFPFLPELALFEWTEAELLDSKECHYPPEVEEGVPEDIQGLSLFAPVLNGNAIDLHFEYPIDEIIAFLKQHDVHDVTTGMFPKKPVSLWLYRLSDPYRCKFLAMDTLVDAWIQLIRTANSEGEAVSYLESSQWLLGLLQESAPGTLPEVFYQRFLNMLDPLLEEGILVGSYPLENLEAS